MRLFFLNTALLMAVSTSAQQGSNEVKWLTHTDTACSVSIQYPSDWQLKPPGANTCFFITSYPENEQDKFRENLNCIKPSAAANDITMKMVEEDIVKSLSEGLADFKIIHSGFSNWNNATAYEIEYTCSKTSNKITYNLHMLQKVAIIKGKMYTLTYTAMSDAYEKYVYVIKRMLQSFKVL